MKSPFVFVSGLLVGVTAGWFGGMKSAPVSAMVQGEAKEARSSAVAPAVSETSASEGPSSRAPRPELPKTLMFDGKSDSPEMKAMVEQVGEKMKKIREEKRARQIDERVAALRARLGLTDEQAAKVRALLESEEPEKGIDEMLVGGGSQNVDVRKLINGDPDQWKATDEKMAALLNSEQQEKFQVFQQEQKENRIEIATSRDMSRLQQALTLTPEQKDKAYQALGGIAQSEDDAPTTGIDPAVLQAKRQSRLDALRPILSPEQMKVYESLPFQTGGGLDGAGEVSIQFQTSEGK